MPYLADHEKQRAIDNAVKDMQVETMDSAELNFTLCSIFGNYVNPVLGRKRYRYIAEVFGSTILALLEFWRRTVVRYEDAKAAENGDLQWP